MGCSFGMPSLVELGDIEQNAALCRELGLAFVELNMNLPYCLPEGGEDLKALRSKYGIGFTFHFPEEIDLAAFYPAIRKANIAFFEELAAWGSEAGVECITLHMSPGVYFSLPDRKEWIYRAYEQKYMRNLMEAMEALAAIGHRYGIKPCVENTTFDPLMKKGLMRLLDIEGIYFTWDMGHDASHGYEAGKFFRENSEKVSHVHIHDYDGAKNHLTLFDGVIDMADRLDFIESNELSAVIEVKTAGALRESVKRLRERKYTSPI